MDGDYYDQCARIHLIYSAEVIEPSVACCCDCSPLVWSGLFLAIGGRIIVGMNSYYNICVGFAFCFRVRGING